MPRFRYTPRANSRLQQIRVENAEAFHSLRGLIIQLSMNPEIDNEKKILMSFGGGREVPVYVDEDWWIVYRVDRIDGEEVLSVISIWDADNPPYTRL